MRLSILTDSINAVVGSDKINLVTQYFVTGDPEITLIVHNEVTNLYFMFYEERDVIKHYEIGSMIAFKKFINKAYNFESGINYSPSFISNIAPTTHIEAKAKAMAVIKKHELQTV